jgi:8-oxo-dGTP pyrophosphatase MutT (NUDIX family)
MIEDGEEPGDGVLREIEEETGIKADRPKVLYATTMLIGGDSYPTLLYCIRLDHESPEVVISWEHSTYEWAPLAKLADVEPQLAPTYREALEYIRSNEILNDL